MGIRPILSALLRNRTGAILVIGQITLTLAIVVNAVFIAHERIKHINRPTGIDVEQLISVISMAFGENFHQESVIQQDIATLLELDNVLGVTAMDSVPLSGSGSASGYSDSGADDADSATANYYHATEGAQHVLGFEMYAGRFFTSEEINYQTEAISSEFSKYAVITKAFAEEVYGTPDVVGKLLYNNLGDAAEVIGVIEHMMGAWVNWDKVVNVAFFSDFPDFGHTRYVIRVKPGTTHQMIDTVKQTLEGLPFERVIGSGRTLQEMADESYMRDNTVAKVLMVVVGLLFLMAGLGILGLASFSVGQRTKQIGTRRAIGARKRDVMSYFLIENWLLTTIGLVFGAVLTVALNIWMANAFELERLNLWYVPLGVVALWCLGFIAVAGPARKATKISPAVATRTV